MSDSTGKQSSGGRRKHFVKNGNKKTSPARDLNEADKELYGFHPLRSLRNIFFGYRSKERPLSASAATKAKSTENLSAINSSRKFDDSSDSDSGVEVTSTTATPAVTAKQLSPPCTKPVKDLTAYDKRRSMPYNKMLSISADDLLETSEWSASAPNSTQQRLSIVLPATCSTTEVTKDTVELKTRTLGGDGGDEESQTEQQPQPSSLRIRSTLDEEETEDFFDEKWASQSQLGRRQRSLSETLEGATRSAEFATDDLDVVDCRHNLDVSIIKNKLAVKQKGKRATALLQQKIAAAADRSARIEDGPRSRDRAVSETGENADVDRHSADSSQLGTAVNERHSLLNGTESSQDAVVSTQVDKQHLKVEPSYSSEERISSTPSPAVTEPTVTGSSVAAARHTPTGPAHPHPTGHKMLVSNEQLADALRRSGTPRSQRLESPSGRSGPPPNTPPKSFKAAREDASVQSGSTSLATTAVTPRTPLNASHEAGKAAATRTPSSGGRSETTPRVTGDLGTGKDGAVASGVDVTKDVATNDVSQVEHQPLKLLNSASMAGTQMTSSSACASGVDSSAITSAVKNLRPRPKTMAPVSGTTTSSEPAWMAELVAKKKTRDVVSNEMTSL